MMNTTLLLILGIFSIYNVNFAAGRDLHTGLNVFELAAFDGYPMEAHEVETEDGYLLGVQRIPHGLSNANETNKPVVFMMHGLVSCSADWINIGKEKSLAYKLADLGYDVWMGNARGNAESRKHVTLNPDEDLAAFWSFSWNEIGRYDLPAMIDYVLAHTNQKQLHYVGFSQGGTSFYVMASSRPEYNAKIKLATTLAPAVEMGHIINPFARMLAPFTEILMEITQALNIREFGRRSQSTMSLVQSICGDGEESQELCKLVLFAICGYDREQLDGNMLSVFLTNTPAGCNLKQFAHYGQGINTGMFRNYDYYSAEKNVEVYGTPEPPAYDLGLVTAPVSFFYGKNDWLVSVIDSDSAISKLPNVVNAKLVDYDAFSHIDFIWAKDVAELLYNDVIEIMERYR